MPSIFSSSPFSNALVAVLVLHSVAGAEIKESRTAEVRILDGIERQRFLAAHNAARTAVGVDPVVWSDEVSRYALESLQQQRDSLIDVAKEGWSKKEIPIPAHRSEPKYGENVAAWMGSMGTNIGTTERAVDIWLREKAAFDKLNANDSYRVGDEEVESDPGDDSKKRPIVVGHYTAIIWRSTKEIGAARLSFELADENGNSRTYVAIVCNYSPPGNRRGESPLK